MSHFIEVMLPLELRLQAYFNDIAGERPALHSLPDSQTASLPLYLRKRYRLVKTQLFGHSWILALSSPEAELASPQEYGQHVSRLALATGNRQVVMVLPSLPSWSRKRLIRERVPFIVPGSQLYLPPFTVDLRERIALPKKASGRSLTPAAQAVLILHLVKERLDDIPLKAIAKRTGYTPMMITKVKDELHGAGLCEVIRKGKSLVLKFPSERRHLWQKAEPKLSSPVRKSHWIKWPTPGFPALAAGITALSNRTMIEDDFQHTFALLDASFRARLKRGDFHKCIDASEANIQLQAWSYDPLLCGDEKNVDSLSLYLSLRDSVDERVRQQLSQLLEQVSW